MSDPNDKQKCELTEDRVRNYRAWCAARVGSLSGADIGVALADHWLSFCTPRADGSAAEVRLYRPAVVRKSLTALQDYFSPEMEESEHGDWVRVSVYDAVVAECEKQKAGWGEAFRLAVFHQDRAEKAEARVAELERALLEIAELSPRQFNGIPVDWQQQIESCADCRRYTGHPIQQGICDQHRQPLWARERHNEDEQGAIGWRAKDIARTALSKGSQP